MARINHRLKASTIAETLIAMLIVSGTFAVAISVYISVVSSSDYFQKQYLSQLLNKMVIQAKNGSLQETKEFDGIVIRSSLQPYNGSEQLMLLQVVALDGEDQIIAKQKEIIYLE